MGRLVLPLMVSPAPATVRLGFSFDFSFVLRWSWMPTPFMGGSDDTVLGLAVIFVLNVYHAVVWPPVCRVIFFLLCVSHWVDWTLIGHYF